VTGILPLFLVAIPAGIVGIVQTGRRPERGRGMAITGLVLGSLWAVFVALGLVALLVEGGLSPAALGSVADAGSTTVGACVADATTAPCSGAHDEEVYAVVRIDDGSWPGEDDVDTQADDACYDAFEPYVGETYDDSDFDYGFYAPDESEWAAGERQAVCVILPYEDDELVGSVRNSGR
jgi:hypothetical protein